MVDPQSDPTTPSRPDSGAPPARSSSSRALTPWAALVALAVLVLVGALSLLSLRPPRPLPAAVPDTAFSAQRAWRHVEAIAAAPHPIGSPAADTVREYLVRTLAELGLEPRVERSTRVVRTSDGVEHDVAIQNVVAVMAGEDPTGAVALVTHYDSHRRAPGAGDDGLAVSALLEAARALRAGPPFRNDLVFLFTDGEEAGFLGARAFVESNPLADRVRVVLNFEGRGSHGPVLMFETGPGNAALVRVFQRADPRPIASSLFPEAYEYLPNDTDFTMFLRAGIRGLNFAHIGHAEHYHRETDTPANASPATLQHHGDHALAMARAFGALDVRTLPGPESADAVYFNAPGFGLVRYPASLAVPHGLAVLALWIAAAVFAWRRRASRLTGLAAGFGLGTLALLLSVGAGWLALRIARLEAEAGSLSDKIVVHEWPYMLAILALAVAAVLLPPMALARRFGADALALGALLIPTLLGLAAAWVAPGASYLLLWPAAFAIAAAWIAARTEPPALREGFLVTGLLIPVVAIWAPHLSLFLTGLTLRMAPTLGLVAGLSALSLAPLAALARRRT